MHPFEEAQGFRALLEREGAGYTIEKIAAKTGKNAAYIAKRLRLLDLIPPVADAFTAGHIGVEHALLIAKLAADVQEKALAHCFRRLLCRERQRAKPRARQPIAGVD